MGCLCGVAEGLYKDRKVIEKVSDKEGKPPKEQTAFMA
jgi:hypothetical protein